MIESPQTSKEIVDLGVKSAVPELCVPVKIYVGHFLYLLQSGVDYVYVPRLISIRKGDTFCPKFLGLPDMLSHQFPEYADKILTHQVNSREENIGTLQNYLSIGRIITQNTQKIRQAIKSANKKWIEFRNLCLDGYNCREAENKVFRGVSPKPSSHDIKIGVIGYVYNVYDNYISMDIINKLNKMGTDAVTFEMVSLSDTEKQLSEKLRKDIFWTFSNKIFAAGYHFFEDPSIDGVIHLTAFGCGPDSFLGKVLDLDSDDFKKPFMTVRIDEHTGESHLVTRIEAFVDMIRRRKFKTSDSAEVGK